MLDKMLNISVQILVLFYFINPIQSQSSTQTIPYIHNSLYATLSSECQTQISVCIPTISSCASNLCKICTSLGISPSIEPCCAAPTPLACFSDYVEGKPITYPTPTRPTGTESTV